MFKNMLRSVLLSAIILSFAAISFGDDNEGKIEKGFFTEDINTFQGKLEALVDGKESVDTPESQDLAFKVDPSGLSLPKSPDEFTQVWHNPPVSQDLTGSCWSFSSTSFFESEIYRIHKRNVKLSEMYTAYWEYVEKARRFIETRGESNFGRGSQANATPRIWKKYGVVPYEAYEGRLKTAQCYDDRAMYNEMKTYLNSLKESQGWNVKQNLMTIRAILDHYMTPPPPSIVVGGVPMTPQEYLDKGVDLNLDDYIDVMSLKQHPFFEKGEYQVWDNWWHSADYYNVPLEEFMQAIRRGIKDGYSICIVGDNSEPGFLPKNDVALVASFDIPSDAINDDARQLRFSNETTTDDHAIHLVGWMEKDGHEWFLIKDSGNRARNGNVPGYMFYRDDFVKLKMMNFMAHKDILGETLERIK